MYFSEHTLFDTAEAFSKNGGTFLYIDEVHKYEGWSRELKAIYDSFPHLHVRFTGSSVLDIEKGEADLSRRAPKYHLQGLSFREFLAMRHNISCEPYTLEEILAHKAAIPEVEHPPTEPPNRPQPYPNTSQAATTRLEAIPNSRSNSAR